MFVAVRSNPDAYRCWTMTWVNIRQQDRGGGPGKAGRVGRPRLEPARLGRRGSGRDHCRHRARPTSYRGYKKGSAEFMPILLGGPSAYRSRKADIELARAG